MNDLERRLQDALRAVGQAYEPADEPRALTEFLQRRRRRRIALSAGTAAAAGAAAAVAFFMMPGAPVEPDPGERAAVRPAGVAAVDVGGEPVGIVYGEGAAWATDRARGTVVQIDPGGEVIARIGVSEAPDDVVAAGGAIWAVDSGNDILTKVDPQTASLVDEFSIPGRRAHLDVAASEDALWLLEEGGTLLRFDLATNQFSDFSLDDDPTDVAVAAGNPWIYVRAVGELRQIDPETGAPAGPAALVGRADDADLAADDDAVWFYGDSDAKLLRVDAASGEVSNEVSLGGTYGGIAVDGDAVWAVVGDGSGGGALHQVAARTGDAAGAAIELTGRPQDVAVGGGSVWVTNAAAGTVTRVDLEVVPPDHIARLGPRRPAVPLEQVVLYFSDGRDVVALLPDGTRRRVAPTAAAELAPSTAPDGASMVFQRRASDASTSGDPPVVVHVDLTTGDERDLGPGSSPAVARDGRIAWVAAGGEGETAEIVIADAEGVPATRHDGLVAAPRNLSWAGREQLLFDGGAEGTAHVLDLRSGRVAALGRVNSGAALFSPLAEQDGIYALRACCRQASGDPLETLELGQVAGDSFTRIKGIDDFGLDPNTGAISLVSAERLDYEIDDGWKRYAERSWFVTDGATLLLVDENGEADRIPVERSLGIAVNPAFFD